MRPTRCPVCETDVFDREVFTANFRPSDLTPEVFSARRTPDRLHYRMVRCGRCGLVRANPVLAPEALVGLYAQSHFTYAAESSWARHTYARALRRALRGREKRDRLLEVGCGSGFFLEEALAQGFREVAGVEPSREAVRCAPDAVRERIRLGLYGPGTFSPSSFDVICAFQVFDHAADPAEFLSACFKDLRAGGLALFIQHDLGALLNRLLGEASPVVDIEHTVLFEKATVRKMFEKAGFRVRDVFGVWNTYPLRYWARLAPLPKRLGPSLVALLERAPWGGLPIPLRAGNLGVLAEKA